MTEAEWLNCSDPEMMLEFLRPKASERKLRLFACACCREPHVWRCLPSRHSRIAVEMAELFADGKATRQELAATIATAPKGRVKGGPWIARCKVHLDAQGQADRAILAAARESAWEAAWETARLAVNLVNWDRQCELIRDIFGNLVHPICTDPIAVRPEVVALAQTIYDARTWDRMSNLADVLAKTGSANTRILAHCRAPGPHARGCWVVDLLLGKS